MLFERGEHRHAFVCFVSGDSSRFEGPGRSVYTNDTEEVAYGFRVIFEAPVTITAYAPIFPDQ